MNRVWKSEVVPNRVRKAEFGIEMVALVGHRRGMPPLWFRLVVIVAWLPNDCCQVLLCGKSTELCVW